MLKSISPAIVARSERYQNPKVGTSAQQIAHTQQTTVDIKYTCISYSLGYLKYLNKYALTANVSAYVKYVNTFACQNYLCKIDLLRIFIPPARNGYAEHNYL